MAAEAAVQLLLEALGVVQTCAHFMLQEAAGHVQPNELGPQVVMELAFQKTTCQVVMQSARQASSAAWGSWSPGQAWQHQRTC